MGIEKLTLLQYMSLSRDEQISDNILGKLRTRDLTDLLNSPDLTRVVKKAIAEHYILSRIDYNDDDYKQKGTKYLSISEFKTLSVKKQMSNSVLSKMQTSKLVKILAGPDSDSMGNPHNEIYKIVISRIALNDKAVNCTNVGNKKVPVKRNKSCETDWISSCSLEGTWQNRICIWKNSCQSGKWYHKTCWARNNDIEVTEDNTYPVLGCIMGLFKIAGWILFFSMFYFLVTILSSDDIDKEAQILVLCLPLGLWTLILFGVSEVFKGIIKFFEKQSQ